MPTSLICVKLMSSERRLGSLRTYSRLVSVTSVPRRFRRLAAVAAKKRHRRVGDELGREQIQLFELSERLQTLGAAVRHIGQRQVEPLQRLDAATRSMSASVAHVRASDTSTMCPLVADDVAALLFDRPNDALECVVPSGRARSQRRPFVVRPSGLPIAADRRYDLSFECADHRCQSSASQLLRSRLVESRSSNE